jgi:hypothetical protein
MVEALRRTPQAKQTNEGKTAYYAEYRMEGRSPVLPAAAVLTTEGKGW